jgi:hypothetical protein
LIIEIDRNLTSDGRWNYHYDAENRLIEMRTSAAAAAAGTPRIKLKFTYDYMGRRVMKQTFAWNPNANPTAYYTSASSGSKFVCDGWNVIADLSLSDMANRTYTWGPDGKNFRFWILRNTQDRFLDFGLKEIVMMFYGWVDGNGNVTVMVNSADGTVAAKYE